jgi:hypothetical protein
MENKGIQRKRNPTQKESNAKGIQRKRNPRFNLKMKIEFSSTTEEREFEKWFQNKKRCMCERKQKDLKIQKLSNAFNMDSWRIVQTNLESRKKSKRTFDWNWKRKRKNEKESWRNPRGRLEIKGLWIKGLWIQLLFCMINEQKIISIEAILFIYYFKKKEKRA